MADPNTEVLYKENGEMHRYLIEWRHKLMVRFLIIVAGLLAASQWVIQNSNMINEKFIALPLMAASLISLGFHLMDKRTYSFMNACLRVGVELERQISPDGFGIYTALSSLPKTRMKYTTVLATMYLSCSVVLFGLGVLVVLK